MSETNELNVSNPDFNCVVEDAVRLLESMSTLYGAERAMEMWSAMGREIGDEVKAQVFMTMLTGHGGTRVRVRRGNCARTVEAIKSIRKYSGLGLKEAKDQWDLTATGETVIDCSKREYARELRRELRDLGMYVS